MYKTTIVLAYTQADVEWACVYSKKHPQENVHILTPTIEGQSTLRKSGRNQFLWYEIEEYEQQYLMDDEKSLSKKARKIVKVIEENLNIKISLLLNINIILLVKHNLLIIYIDLLHAYTLHKRIINKWKPYKIFLPLIDKDCYKTGDGIFFSLAYYIQWYFKDSSRQYLTYSTISNKSRFFRKSVPFMKLFLLKYVIQKWYFLIKNHSFFEKPIFNNRKHILMETGGIITSYFYNFYALASRRFNFLLVTYKLQLHQQIPLLKKKIPFVAFNSLWVRGDNKLLDLVKKSLQSKLKNISKINFTGLIPRLDNKLQKALIDQTKLFVEKNADNTLKKLIINTKLLKNRNPNLIINTHDPSSTGLSLVLPGKHLKTPSVLLLHGIPVGKHHSPITSDILITWGKKTKLHFQKYSNMNKKAVLSSGFPLIDQYSKLYRTDKNNKKRAANIRLGLLLTNYHPNDSYLSKFIFELIYSLRNTIGITVNFRLHEGYNLTGVKQLAEEYNVKVNDHTNKDLDDFIVFNDIFLSLDTTAILWPMIYRKPLFYTSPLWGESSLPIKEYHAAWIPGNADELVSKIEEFTKNPGIYKELLKGQRKFLEDYAGPLDGQSSLRLLNIISKLAK